MDTARTTESPLGTGEPQPRATSRASVAVWLLAAILAILVGWALKALAVVVVPFVAALFIALAVAPLDRAVRERMPRGLKWLGHAAAMTIVLVILVAFFVGIYVAAMQAVGQLPNVTDELRAALGAEGGAGVAAGASPETAATLPLAAPGEDGGDAAGAKPEAAAPTPAPDGRETGAAAPEPAGSAPPQGSEGGILGLGMGLGLDPQALVDRAAAYLAEHGTEYARAILSAAAGLLTGLALVFFLALLMLVEGPVWRAKMANAWSRTRESEWEDTFAMMALGFRRYFLVTMLLGAITASLYAGWLALFGVGLLAVWFVLTFLLAFIPTIGSIIAGVLPIIYTFVTRDWATALYVSIGIIAIEQVTGNYLSPRLLGKKLSVSPIVTFFALVLFGWLWGTAGAILAVPMAVLMVIAFAHIEPLRPVALVLSDRRDMAGLEEVTTR